LLDSDELQAASENSVIAAVTFWLEQTERVEKVTKQQKQRLAHKLRLFCATPWYLTRILLEEGHWLSKILSSEQKLVLTAAAHNPVGWGRLQVTENGAMSARLFRRGNLVKVSWWEKERPASAVTEAELLVEVSLAELWSNRGAMYVKDSRACYYNGIMWGLRLSFPRAGASKAETWIFKLGAYIKHGSSGAPVAFTAHIEAVGAAPESTMKRKLHQDVLWLDGHDWGFPNLLGITYTSLEDATAKLAPFIHPDGKLHIKGRVTEVR
jgi:hypothetical protein